MIRQEIRTCHQTSKLHARAGMILASECSDCFLTSLNKGHESWQALRIQLA